MKSLSSMRKHALDRRKRSVLRGFFTGAMRQCLHYFRFMLNKTLYGYRLDTASFSV